MSVSFYDARSDALSFVTPTLVAILPVVHLVLGLLLALVIRSLSGARMPRDTLGLFIIVGVVGIFVFHILVNVGMVIGFMPITGIPLPFVSYGGSSLMTAFIGLGLVISVRRCRYVN